MRLSDRLETVISAVKPVFCAADIGTDHGFVPVELVRRGICTRAIAADINPGPLARAEEHIAEAGLSEKITVKLSDGLSGLCEGEAGCFIITGMGGELIIKILKEGSELWDTAGQWILSPQSEQYKVRAFLDRNGFLIRDEKFIYEDGKYYNILDAVRTGEAARADDPAVDDEFNADYVYGRVLIDKKDPLLIRFLSEEERKLEDICRRLGSGDNDSESLRQGFLRAERLLLLNREVQDEMR